MRKSLIPLIVGIGLLLAAAIIFYALAPLDLQATYHDLFNKLDSAERQRIRAEWMRQTAVLPATEVASIVGPQAERSPGAVVIGLIDKNRQLILGWGKDLQGKDAGGDTIFETASVSKAFAGLLLGQMVQTGEVQLEEPVEDLADSRVPTSGGHKITLRQLATHSSGLPPWPDNRGDTTVRYTHEDLCGYLQHATLLGAPDAGVMYSNTAFALLGDVLARKEGLTFEQLLQKRICEPLGMSNTGIRLSEADKKRLAIGHWAGGSAARSSAPTASGAADGIRSTVRDLLKLVSAYIGIQPTDFEPAMKLSQQSYIAFSERLDSGLGWFIDTDDNTVEKSGKISGYRSHVAFDPETKVAVVVLAGWEAFPSPEVGKKLLHRMIQRRKLIESGAFVKQ